MPVLATNPFLKSNGCNRSVCHTLPRGDPTIGSDFLWDIGTQKGLIFIITPWIFCLWSAMVPAQQQCDNQEQRGNCSERKRSKELRCFLLVQIRTLESHWQFLSNLNRCKFGIRMFTRANPSDISLSESWNIWQLWGGEPQQRKQFAKWKQNFSNFSEKRKRALASTEPVSK